MSLLAYPSTLAPALWRPQRYLKAQSKEFPTGFTSQASPAANLRDAMRNRHAEERTFTRKKASMISTSLSRGITPQGCHPRALILKGETEDPFDTQETNLHARTSLLGDVHVRSRGTPDCSDETTDMFAFWTLSRLLILEDERRMNHTSEYSLFFQNLGFAVTSSWREGKSVRDEVQAQQVSEDRKAQNGTHKERNGQPAA